MRLLFELCSTMPLPPDISKHSSLRAQQLHVMSPPDELLYSTASSGSASTRLRKRIETLVDETTLMISPLLPVGGGLPSGLTLDVSVVGSGPNSGQAIGGGSPSMTRFDRCKITTGGPTQR